MIAAREWLPAGLITVDSAMSAEEVPMPTESFVGQHGVKALDHGVQPHNAREPRFRTASHKCEGEVRVLKQDSPSARTSLGRTFYSPGGPSSTPVSSAIQSFFRPSTH